MPIYNAKDHNEKYDHKIERHPLPTDCATSNYTRLIHDEQTWRLLQTIYYEQTIAKRSYHHRIHARHRYLWYSGIPDDSIQVRDDKNGRGRSLYAIEDIPASTVVWYVGYKGQTNDAEFCTRKSMTDFLERFPHDLQCDVMLWAYAVKDSRCVECNLDEASFYNHAERPELVNVVTSDELRNTRYIKKGEELLMDYNSFIGLGILSVPWWDKLRNTAWKEIEKEGEKETNSSTSNSTNTNGGDEEDCMDGYVKYGKPKSSTSSTTSSVFADAKLIHNAPTTSISNNDFCVALISLFLAFVLARGFVTAGGRRR